MSGVDTLVRGFLAAVPGPTLERLAAAKEEARQRRELGHKDATIVRLADLEWVISPSGAPPYRYLLHCEGVMDLRVAGRPLLAGGTPTVMVEIRSEHLWRRGFVGAADDAQNVARELLGAPDRCLDMVTRIDLCCDFQGWLPDGSDGEAYRFATYSDEGFKREGLGRGFTGYRLAPGQPLSARLYDKSREIKKSKKGWFRYLWKRSPHYDPKAPVWRLEVQARSEALSEMELRLEWDAQICERLDELWRFAFGRADWHPDRETDCERALRLLKQKQTRRKKRGLDLDPDELAILADLLVEREDEKRRLGAWLSLRDAPSEGAKPKPRGEWPIAADWRAIQNVTFTDPGAVRGLREAQRQVQLENCLMQMRGLLSTYAVHLGQRPSQVPDRREARARTLSRAFSAAHEGMMDLDEGEPRDFIARMEEKIPLATQAPGEDPPRRVELPEAPWEPAADTRRTLPYQVPSMLELRSLPRTEITADSLPHRPWHDSPTQQIELSEATLEWHRALAKHDEAEDRRLQKRLRFAARPVEKRLPKVQP